MRTRDLTDYGILSVVWGLSFLVLLRVVQAFGWVGAVTFRALLAGGLLYVIATVTRRKLDFGVGWRPLTVVGATTVAGQLVGMSFATPRIGTAMAAIIVGTIPLFSMIIGQVWGLERITVRGWVGLGLGFAGIVLLVGFPAVPVTASFVVGCVGSLLAAVAAAYGSNYARHRLRGVGSWEVTTGAFLAGGLMTLPLLFVVPVPAPPRPVDIGYLLHPRWRDERAGLRALLPARRRHRRDAGDQRRVRGDRRRRARRVAAAARAVVGAATGRRGRDHRRLRPRPRPGTPPARLTVPRSP